MTLVDRNHLENVCARLHVSIDGSFGKSKPVEVVEVEVENSRRCTKTMTLAFVENKWHVMGSVEWLLIGPLFKAQHANQDGAADIPLASQLLQTLVEGFKLHFHGAVHDVVVRNELEAAYCKHMNPKPKIDTSGLLLLEVGQQVEVGQELAMVEAMKMQNSSRRVFVALISNLILGSSFSYCSTVLASCASSFSREVLSSRSCSSSFRIDDALACKD
ncbi:hypothetical protein PsorP6_008675 [Peronosclerospora sorghi]|uniref:Uncharacterized protein n=1 Tax=Peronosclerospora sorghi TaxID=230839 RepID=A0ACC0W239_9STRA|nr:hypothetical protein PsorP6_008675 [Peronosclerospora sorghi]